MADALDRAAPPRRGDAARRGALSRALLATSALGAILLLAPGLSQAQAQQDQGNPLLSSGPVDAQTDQPMLLQADDMVYDNQNNLVVARGNVEIYYGAYTLLADQVTYNRGANTLEAEGNVRIKQPDGAIVRADRITLTDDFRDGFIRSLQIVTEEDVRIGAAQAVRHDAETTVFERAVFTPCLPCETNPEAPPTWSIKSGRVIHSKSEATITYENATFDFMGYSVLWVPWFRHADPSVKRKSGFLMPVYSNSDRLGSTLEVPYYFALAPNYDFTFSPMVTEEQGTLFKGHWRHRLTNGRYEVKMAGISESDPEDDDDFRGYVDTRGHFAYNEHWNWGWDVTVDSDTSFRRYYDIDNEHWRDHMSQLYLVGQKDRNYFSMRGYHIGTLGGGHVSDPMWPNAGIASDPLNRTYVHPVVDYNYIKPQPVLGGELSFNANILSLSRDETYAHGATTPSFSMEGVDSSRLIADMNWRRELVDTRGQIFTPFFGARGDIYQVSDGIDPSSWSKKAVVNNDDLSGLRSFESDTITRGMAHAGMEYRYPFVANTGFGTHVLEPVAQVIARPDVADQGDIPNEDALSLVFDDTLLFDIDKNSGFDRIETGTRANLGMRYTLHHFQGGYLQAAFGQSIHLGGDNDFPADSGLDTTRSDYVAGLYLKPSENLSFIAQQRFDESNFEARRTDLTANAYYGPFTTSVNYASLDAQPGLDIFDNREEVRATGKVQLTEHWSAFGQIRYDLEREERLTDAIGLRWADDCFALSVSYQESFYRDRDIEPDQKIMLRFDLKYLGTYDVDVDPTFVADSDTDDSPL